MKTFEERMTAWIDGELHGEELSRFERELESRPESSEEKRSSEQIGSLLRQHSPRAEMPNVDFFNHQLIERIRANEPAALPQKRGFSWSVPALAWAGAFSLAIAGVLYYFVIPPQENRSGPPPQYFAEVIEVHTPDPGIYATALETGDSVAVVWLDGLEYIPETYALK